MPGTGHGGAYVVQSIPLPITSVSNPKFFYEAGITTTAAFVKTEFGLSSGWIALENAGANSIEYSFNGTDLHGTLAAGESIQFEDVHARAIWLKNGAGASTVNVQAWPK